MKDTEIPTRNAPAIWVYALAECGAGAMLPGIAGVAGEDVRLVDCAGLTAVVSDVGLAEFGAQALRRNMEDLAWLESVARAHHGVIDAAARLFTLLPMRLATVYTSEESMAAGLGVHAARFRSALVSLRSRTEWGVKAYVAPAAQAAGSPAAGSGDRATDGAGTDGAATDGAGTGGPAASPAKGGAGVAYLRRRRDALSASRDFAGRAAESAQAVHAELERYAAGSRLHPPQSPQLSGRWEQMLLNAAYLLDDDRAADFAVAVEALNDQDPRLRLELTGPWPPYSFAVQDLVHEQEGA